MADWIFQASAREHDLDAQIAASSERWWGTPRYRDRIAVGDRAWMQVTGPHHPGIYYVATIVSATYEHPAQPGEPAYARWRTDIRIDYRITPPLLRSELLDDATLESFRPFHGFQGSDVPVPPAAIVAVFNADYTHTSITPSDGDDLVWSPTDSQTHLLALIDGAQHSLDIEQEEFSDTTLVNAIVADENRGVTVRVVIEDPSEYSSELNEITAAGGKVTGYSSSTGFYIHAKTVIADYGYSTAKAFVGSENFSSGSLNNNRELGLITTDSGVVTGLETTFDGDFSGSDNNKVSIFSPGTQTTPVGGSVYLQTQGEDTCTGSLSYKASGLPAGLSISSTTGLISGTPTTAATSSVTVTATDTTGASGSATFSWTISAASGCGPQQLIQNGGFATGSLTPWTASSGVLTAASSSHPSYPSTDPYLAWIDGYSGKHTDTLSQTVTIPASCTTATLSFWLYIDSDDPTSKAYDTFTTQVLNSSGTVLATLGTLSNQNEGTGYVEHSYSVSSFIGQTITIKFTGTETLGDGYDTSFFEDDNSLNAD